MNRFIIESIRLKNFRGYLDGNFEFFKGNDNKSGIIVLSGSNGYGKTTIIDAIEWCLTGTIHRILREVSERKENGKLSNALAKGIIRNSNTKESVIVELNASFNNNKIFITRKFEGKDELEALDPSMTSMSYLIPNNNISEEAIDKIISELSSNFYNKYVCSYEKNIHLYEKSREDIYKLFSGFFSGTEEIDKIISNLEGFGKGKNKVKGIIDKIEDERNGIYEAYISSKGKYDNHKTLVEEISTNIKKHSGYNDSLELYPDVKLYEEEMTAKELDNVDDLNKLKVLYSQINNLKLIKKKIVSNKVKEFISFWDLNNKNNYFLEKVKQPFIEKQGLISKIQLMDLLTLNEDKKILLDIINKLNRIQDYQFIDSFISENKDELRERVFLKSPGDFKNILEKASEIKNKIEEKSIYDAKLEAFKTNDPINKALREIVNNITGLEQYRENGHNVCPLCGSGEKFISTQLAFEAKKFLGEADKERQEINSQSNLNKKAIDKLFIEIKKIIEERVSRRIHDIDHYIEGFSETKEVQEALKSIGINFKEVSNNILDEYENELGSQLDKYKNMNQCLSYILSVLSDSSGYLLDIYDTSLNNSFVREEDFIAWDSEKQIKSFKQFLEENGGAIKNIELSHNYTSINSINEIIEKKLSVLVKIKDMLENNNQLNSESEKLVEFEKNFNKHKKDLDTIDNYINQLKLLLSRIKKQLLISESRLTSHIIEPVQTIYRRINRHTNFNIIDIDRAGKTAQKMNLNVVDNYENKCFISNVLSTGQLSSLSISIYLATAIVQKNEYFRCFFMDDPIQSMDDLNILSFVDLLRSEMNESIPEEERFMDQLFISTCDSNLEKLLIHKMKYFDVNYCLFSFESYCKYK